MLVGFLSLLFCASRIPFWEAIGYWGGERADVLMRRDRFQCIRCCRRRDAPLFGDLLRQGAVRWAAAMIDVIHGVSAVAMEARGLTDDVTTVGFVHAANELTVCGRLRRGSLPLRLATR